MRYWRTILAIDHDTNERKAVTMSSREERDNASEKRKMFEHQWVDKAGLRVCRLCGIVHRAGGPGFEMVYRPCPGSVPNGYPRAGGVALEPHEIDPVSPSSADAAMSGPEESEISEERIQEMAKSVGDHIERLEDYSTDDLVNELFQRCDHGVVSLMFVDADEGITRESKWKGNNDTAMGMCHVLQDLMLRELREAGKRL